MNYIEMLQQISPERLALVEDGIPYHYGELVELVEKRSREMIEKSKLEDNLYFIRKEKISEQLIDFLAAQKLEKIPVILPNLSGNAAPFENLFGKNSKLWWKESMDKTGHDDPVCMGVCTSGSRGVPKIYFRTYESWADFFPVQNRIFGIDADSRLFAQGSLSFTGNLNLYLAQFSIGGTVVAQNEFAPRKWLKAIKEWEADCIYLIPDKLLCLPKTAQEKNKRVRTILSGSQSLGRLEVKELKKVFPDARVILYYGASELNYITYITDAEMTQEKNLVGKAFPEVGVTVQNGEIFVDTEYHVSGISCPYTLSDTGYFDQDGMLHFTGRSDDIVNVRGRKVSTYRMEEALLKLYGVEEAAVTMDEKEHFIGFVRSSLFSGNEKEFSEKNLLQELKQYLQPFEIPKRIICVEKMPKNDSGKIDKKRLMDF